MTLWPPAKLVSASLRRIMNVLLQARFLPIPSYSCEILRDRVLLYRGQTAQISCPRGWGVVCNAGAVVWKNFLFTTDADVQSSLDANFVAAFGLSSVWGVTKTHVRIRLFPYHCSVMLTAL
jgi:hypothetical protein